MESDGGLLSNWALGVAAVLVVITGIIAGFATIGYIVSGRSIKRPFLRYIIRYAVVFLLFLTLEAIILWLAPSVHRTLQHLTAVAAGKTLRLASVHNMVSGSTITVREPLLTFQINAACLGGLLFWAYIALVLAEPRTAQGKRLVGLGVGLVCLITFNLFRIFVSIYIEWHTRVNVHNYFYLLNMLFVLLVWAIWVWTLRPGTEQRTA